MTAGARPEDAPKARRAERKKGTGVAVGVPIPKRVVHLAAISILPWTVGSLLSPFGPPHAAFLVLPPVALLVLIAAVRTEAQVRWTWVPWLLSGLLVATSLTRFIVIPILGEMWTGGEDLDVAGPGILRVMQVLLVTMQIFYLTSLLVLLHGLWALRRWRPGAE